MAERFETTKFALQVVQTLGIVLAVASLHVSYKSFKAEHEWKRRQFTAELLGNFNANIKEHRSVLIQAFPGLGDADTGIQPSKEECRKIIKAKKGQYIINGGLDTFEVRDHLVGMFNYFEHVAYSYEAKLGNQPDIEASMSNVILRWHNFFSNCIQEVYSEFGGDVWPPLTRVVGTWKLHQGDHVIDVPATDD
ncbi:MAG: hypothetical protein PHH11_13745 [Methylomonas sp.]|nr:hypothetical protein [Methylomonas sp.]